VTRSETLAEKLQSYSRSLVATLSQKAIVPTLPFKPELSDQRTLLELEPSDFPLVCNYDQFLVMLETAVNAYDRGAPRDVSKKPTRTNLVDFKAFRNIYWPHFPLDLIKGLSPHLVFSDIMGMIKGSVQTCKTLISLQAQEYKDLSARVAPNVTSASDRVKVFRIFELYEKLKHKAGEHDSIDRVVHILKQIRSDMNLRALLADCVQEFYIDEVQDFRCLDIELFLTLGNDSRAFNFGGDTAQGISQDSSFRFQDVKALFYDHFSRQSVAIGQEALAQPQLFTLNRNYRSHQGILSLASSVMSLLWRNFPDNVDNLGPEVGSLAGPVPVLFLGCDTSILLHNDPGDSSSPAHELLFGAEQVILTRDDVGKDKLIQKIGETALVLTILQAKGMEFDDVILWDFFSTTPDPAGWRSLQHSSHGESSRFDVVKHAAICSELKHLYVAITRARVRFIMIEGIEEAAQPFVQLMVKKSTLALLEVKSPTSTDFIEKIKVLQPRRSDNPQRWLAIGGDMMARGLFAEACLCFRRAEDRPREEHAKAHLQEVQGIELMARGEELNSHIKLKAAATAFEGLGLTTDATRVLLRLGLPEEAAELWYKKRDFKQAADLFEKASNYKRASDSWHLNNEQSKAMACLHTGALYDQMVVYFANNKGRLSGPEVLRYQRSTKLLIKQGKISEAYRGAAIGLLGNLAQQEAFYLEYNMIEGLLELYQAQHATAKVLKTLVKLDRLEEALNLASSLPFQDKAVIDQPELSRLQAIVWVDRIYLNLSHAPAIVVEEGRMHTWQHAFHVLRIWDHSSAQEEIMSLESGSLIKAFLCLYTTVNVEGTTSATNYDELPLDLLRETVKIVKGQQPGLNGVVGEAVLLLCGVHRHLDSQQKYNVRAWSPLRKIQQVSRDGNSLNKAAMQWMTSQVSRAVMRVHELARNMFGTKWPTRCSQYLVVGRCTDRNKNRGCTSLHEHVTPSAYMKYLEDLLLMNGLLCEMTVLYHQRVMSEDDSKNFLGARRFWLERLSIALTYVSGFEQDSMVLNEITKSIRTEESLRVVASCLEDHLLYKARNEWKSQGTVGYVLEQLDLAAHLGERVKATLIRRTREQLRHHNPLTQAAIILLEQLQTHIIGGPSAAYSLALKAYLNGPQGIMKLNWDSNRAFHCHTSVFEGIAFYLLLQISPSSVVIPRSWVDLHLPSILRRNKPNSPLDPNPKMMSRDAMIVLLRHFDDLLEWANERLQANHQFAACGHSYPSGVLHQRNYELLAVVLCNLYSLCQPTSGSNWQDMLRALEVRLVRLKCLDHTVGNVNGLRNKLLASHSCYRGKNPLLILNVADVHPHPFTAFQRSNNLTSESLTSLRTHLAPAQPSKVTPTLDADQPAQEETAARCIQKHWRKVSPRLKARKAFANSERGRIIVDFHILAKGSGLKIRSSLFRLGLVCLSNLGPLGSAISALNKRALDTVEKAGFEDTEVLDMVLGGVSDLREGLTRHNTRLSDEVLGSLVRAKDENGLEEMLQRQLKLLAEDEKVVAELEHILDGVTKGGV
jgi:tetratricopeptide (TPR) repeat protein